jgi:hypothetical protein
MVSGIKYLLILKKKQTVDNNIVYHGIPTESSIELTTTFEETVPQITTKIED